MNFIPPPPPNVYKYVEDMNAGELSNKGHALKREIANLYQKLRELDEKLGKDPTLMPDEYNDIPDAKPFPKEITPNVIMRSYKVDGTIEREHYNAVHRIKDCHDLILKIEARIAEMISG